VNILKTTRKKAFMNVLERCYIQNVPEISTINCRVSAVAQNSENHVHKHESRNASVMVKRKGKIAPVTGRGGP
jgi:hypothetical protein